MSDRSEEKNNWQGNYSQISVAIAAIGVGSYYLYRMYTQKTIPDTLKQTIAGKTIIVTGANSGVGFAAAEQLAKLGGNVILACRDGKSAANAVADIQKYSSQGHVKYEVLDVSDIRSIYDFSKRIDKCHILINNAGALFPTLDYKNNVENTFMTNYVGPWLLSRLLLPILAKTSIEDRCEVKVINVGSRTEKFSPFGKDFQKLESNSDSQYAHVSSAFRGPSNQYSNSTAYANSKLANTLFSFELSRRLQRSDAMKTIRYSFAPTAHNLKTTPTDSQYPQISVNLVTPGMVNTNLARNASPLLLYASYPFRSLFLKSPSQGGAELVYAAVQSNVTGKYFGEHREIHASEHGQSIVLAKLLWEVTEKVVEEMLRKENIH
jgi:NAD(P)-dependent dehydrogenase (short-subunit alcohol dehydrogenase family)